MCVYIKNSGNMIGMYIKSRRSRYATVVKAGLVLGYDVYILSFSLHFLKMLTS